MASIPGPSPAGAAARICGTPITDALSPHLGTADLCALRLTCRHGRAAFGATVRAVPVAAPADAAAAASQAAARAFVNARRAALSIMHGGALPSAALRALAGMPSLRELELQGGWADEDLEAVGLTGLAGLTALTFRWCAVRTALGAAAGGAAPALAGLPQLTGLRELALVDCGLGGGGGGGGDANTEAVLRALPRSLQELDLDGNPLGKGGVTAVLAALRTRLPQLTALRELNLGNCEMGSDKGGGDDAATVLRALPPSLERLHLDWTPLGKATDAPALVGLGARLPQLTALRVLGLFDCCLLGLGGGGGDAAAAVLRALPPSLQELRLDGNPLDTGRGAPALVGLGARLPQLTALRTLGLGGCGLGVGGRGKGAAAAAVVRALPPSLEELDLDTNPLGNQTGAAALTGLAARLPQLTALRNLGLGGCSLGDSGGGGVGAAAAAVLRELPPSLQALCLNNNPLGNEGEAAALNALRTCLPQLTVLRKLYLSGCSLGGRGGGEIGAAAVAAVLRELPPSLEQLHLDNNPLGKKNGAAALAALCARLPQLTALQKLGLGGSGLGGGLSDGVAAMAAVLRALPPSLEELHLENNPLGKKGGAAALAALRARLPHLRVSC